MSTPDSYNPQQYQPAPQSGVSQPGMPPAPGFQPYMAGPEINGKAVAALVTGVFFATAPLLGIISLVLGKSAQREIEAGQGIGRALAKAGRVLGWISIGFTIFWALYVVIIIAAFASAASSFSTY